MWTLLSVLVACGSQPPGTADPLGPTRERSDVVAAGPLPEYRLSLVLDTAGNRVKGHEAVTVVNQADIVLSDIVFRLYPNLPQYGGRMSVGPVWVDGERTKAELRANDTSLRIPLSRSLKPSASTIISMTFDVTIPERSGGYVLFGHSQGVWSLPDAYPLLALAMAAGPNPDGSTAWHEALAPSHGDAVFAGAALYEAHVTLPSSLTLAATGSVLTVTRTADGRLVHHLAGGPLREFAWLASAEYGIAEAEAYDTTVRSYYLPGDETAGQAALNVATAALRTYSDAFGPYPFSELVVVEAPLTYYGMEYSGLNLIGSELYSSLRHELEIRVAHEIAHQWWYNQVGNDQVNTPWLDEGLAEFSTAIYHEAVYGQARANALINQRWSVPHTSAVANGLDAVVNQPSSSFGEEYEVIVYAKAALFFEALRRQVGDATFNAILEEYTREFQWRIATPDGFLQVAEAVSGQDLDVLYSRWILSRE